MSELFSTLADPAARHAIFGHAPIALCVFGLICALFSAWKIDHRAARWTTVIVFLLLAAAAYATVQSGEAAEGALITVLDQAASETLETHESLAQRTWMFALLAALLGLASLPERAPKRALSWVIVLVAILCAGWIGWTAHHGGLLVYAHGVGVPSPGLAPNVETVADTPAASNRSSSDPRVDHFESNVLPVLSQTCWKCHNPARKRRSGRLDQTTIAGMLEGGLSGASLVPGSPETSLIIERVLSDDPELVMPQKGDRLSAEQIDDLSRWIRDGAVWSDAADELGTRQRDESPR